MPELTIIVPAYNELNNLRVLLPEWLHYCKNNNYKLIVVDDGSTDGTKDFIKSQADKDYLSVIRHKLNRGYGAALKSGIEKTETPLIMTMDADGQHEISYVQALLKFMRETGADMVIGSRQNFCFSFYVRAGKWIIRSFVRILFSVNIKDLNSGMKIFDAARAKRYIRICPDLMAFSDIFVLVFINQGALVLECPIKVNSRRQGKSNIIARTALETMWEILNIAMLFKPAKVFLPFSILFWVGGITWGLPIFIRGLGISIGASLLILSGLIFFFLGLLAEQLSLILRGKIAQ